MLSREKKNCMQCCGGFLLLVFQVAASHYRALLFTHTDAQAIPTVAMDISAYIGGPVCSEIARTPAPARWARVF